MSESVIAIRTADGAWFPVLERSSRGRKRVVLTTARKNQDRVHVDMYEGPDEDLGNSEYIGSLVLDNIDPAEAGSVEIEFVAGIDEREQLKATATNRMNGDSESLSINLDQRGRSGAQPPASEALDDEDLPDFSMEDDFDDDDDLDLDLPEENGDTVQENPESPDFDFDLGDGLEEPPLFDAEEDESGESPGFASESGDIGSGLDDLDDPEREPDTDFSSLDEDLGDDLGEHLEAIEEDLGDLDDSVDLLDGDLDLPDAESDADEERGHEPAQEEVASAAAPERSEDSSLEEELGLAADDGGEQDTADSRRFATSVPPYPGAAAKNHEGTSLPANRGASVAFYIAYMLLALAILAGLVYLIYGAFQADPIPPLEATFLVPALPTRGLRRARKQLRRLERFGRRIGALTGVGRLR